ncbi:MFS transporter [Ramlibacter albus]|uniref:MFS transporter n=1 Tax=Ramlibacter albus TaxID=2079448 RepID=A0A923S6R4_9BURK|nr:MFS transporter [Ramlibacter albus]MBC5766417.1 MFS transporter [Ramlibacter albus]
MQWYFGWNIVAASAVLTLLCTGMRLGIGPFFLPMAGDLGFSRSALASIVAVGMIVYGLAMPVAGHLIARRGTRFVLVLGAALVVAACIWTTQARDTTSFLLAFGIVLSVGLAFMSPVAFTPIISHWFTRQRGMALFFLSTGSMAGIALMTPLFTATIAAFSWRATMLGFAAVVALLALPAAIFIMRDEAPANTDLLPHEAATPAASRPAAPSARLADALRTAPFWMIFLGLFSCGFSMNLMGTHALPMLMDHGFDAHTSSFGIGLIGLVAIGGTIVLGRWSDRLPRRNILALIYGVRGLGFFALVIVGTQWELYAAASIGGLVWAGSIALSSAILADLYGVKLVGVLYGLAFIGHQVGGMISAWLGGWGYEHFGTHWVAFGSAGVLLLAAAILSLQLPVRNMRAA